MKGKAQEGKKRGTREGIGRPSSSIKHWGEVGLGKKGLRRPAKGAIGEKQGEPGESG